MFDCQSPTSPFMGSLRALHLLEELRSVLEVMDSEERESLRCQIPDSTVESLGDWIHAHLVRRQAARHSTSEYHASIPPPRAPRLLGEHTLNVRVPSVSARCGKHADFLEARAVVFKAMGHEPDECQSFCVMV